MIETVIAIPVMLAVFGVIYDFGRIYTAIVFCQDVALMAAKVANAADPDVDIPTTNDLIKSVPGEDLAITAGRTQFWTDQLAPASATYHGANYYTDKELQTLNLAYGYLNLLNNKVAFPIPVLSPLRVNHLGGVTNCSIYFEFPNIFGPLNPELNYSRIFTVECAVPLLAIPLAGGLIAQDGYLTVSRSAYAHQSGGTTP